MTAPQQRLATALAGTISGTGAIRVGTGGVYVLPERRKIGSWRDGTDALVAAYWAVVGSAVVC